MKLSEIKERIERVHRWSKALQEEVQYLLDALSSSPTLFHFQSPEAEAVEETAARKVKYEFKGMDCAAHGQAPHRRERLTLGVWICDECHPTKYQPPRGPHVDHQASD
jgi:hypothetical protein